MNRSEDLHRSIPGRSGTFWVAAIGASTSAPTVPADGPFTPSTSTYPRRGNGISKLSTEAPTRSSTGVYVITYGHQLPTVWNVHASVLAAGGSPTGTLSAAVTAVNAATRQITVKVTTITSNALTDLGANDMLVLTCHYQNSNA